MKSLYRYYLKRKLLRYHRELTNMFIGIQRTTEAIELITKERKRDDLNQVELKRFDTVVGSLVSLVDMTKQTATNHLQQAIKTLEKYEKLIT